MNPGSIFAESLDLEQIDHFYKPVTVVSKADGETTLELTVCLDGYDCRECDRKQPMFFAHLCCWQVVNEQRALQGKDRLSFRDLIVFASQTRPLYCAAEGDESEAEVSPLQFGGVPNRDTDLGRLLTRTARLPAEIQHLISSNFDAGLLRSLVRASQTAGEFLDRLCAPGPWLHHEALDGSEIVEVPTDSGTVAAAGANANAGAGVGAAAIVDRLTADFISVFGQFYLRRLTADGEYSSAADGAPASTPRTIRVRRSSVTGLKYVLGLYGIRAVAVTYADGSSSPWLGDPTKGWHGRIQGNDLRLLQILRDVRLSSLSVSKSHTSRVSSVPQLTTTLCRT
jgi:hypothetical protein